MELPHPGDDFVNFVFYSFHFDIAFTRRSLLVPLELLCHVTSLDLDDPHLVYCILIEREKVVHCPII